MVRAQLCAHPQHKQCSGTLTTSNPCPLLLDWVQFCSKVRLSQLKKTSYNKQWQNVVL